MLNGSPKTNWNGFAAKSQLERLLFIHEYLAFLDLIVSIDLAIRADSWSPYSLWQMPIVLKLFSLSHLAVLTDNIDFDAAQIFIKYGLLFLFNRFLGCRILTLFLIFSIRYNFGICCTILSFFNVFWIYRR